MNLVVLLFVVLVQVLLFQFLSVPFTRARFAILLGDGETAREVAGETQRYLRASRRFQFVFGGLLAAAALLSPLVPTSDPGLRKLILAAVSVASSLALVASYAADRRAVGRVRASLPDPGLRIAPLTRRSLRRYYHPAWEAIPVAVFLGTAVFTLWALPRVRTALEAAPAGSGEDPLFLMHALPIVQGLIVIGFLAYALRGVTGAGALAARLLLPSERPEVALELGEILRATEIRHLLAVKIGIPILLAVSQAEIVLSALGHALAPAFDRAAWAMVTVLLLVFGRYIWNIVMVARRRSPSAGGPGLEPTG